MRIVRKQLKIFKTFMKANYKHKKMNMKMKSLKLKKNIKETWQNWRRNGKN